MIVQLLLVANTTITLLMAKNSVSPARISASMIALILGAVMIPSLATPPRSFARNAFATASTVLAATIGVLGIVVRTLSEGKPQRTRIYRRVAARVILRA